MTKNLPPFNAALIALYGANSSLRTAHDKLIELGQGELAERVFAIAADTSSAIGKLVIREATKAVTSHVAIADNEVEIQDEDEEEADRRRAAFEDACDRRFDEQRDEVGR